MANATYEICSLSPDIAYLAEYGPMGAPMIRIRSGQVLIKDVTLGPFTDFQEAANHLAAMNDGTTVVVDRARFERLRDVAETAHEWVNAPEDSGIGRRAEDALTHLVDALQPGDIGDPLP